jgi:hypothetical protein
MPPVRLGNGTSTGPPEVLKSYAPVVSLFADLPWRWCIRACLARPQSTNAAHALFLGSVSCGRSSVSRKGYGLVVRVCRNRCIGPPF